MYDVLLRGGAYEDVLETMRAIVSRNGSSADRDDERDARVARLM